MNQPLTLPPLFVVIAPPPDLPEGLSGLGPMRMKLGQPVDNAVLAFTTQSAAEAYCIAFDIANAEVLPLTALPQEQLHQPDHAVVFQSFSDFQAARASFAQGTPLPMHIVPLSQA